MMEVRIQGVLEEAEQGDVILHRHISSRDLSYLEPIAHESVFRGKFDHQLVAVKFFKTYLIGFQWNRFRREVAILAYVSPIAINS